MTQDDKRRATIVAQSIIRNNSPDSGICALAREFLRLSGEPESSAVSFGPPARQTDEPT